MNPDDLFGLANMLALPGWAILILAPRRWAWVNAIPALMIPLALSALYTGLVLAYFSATGGGYGTLADVRQLFASDPVLVAGWAHYLAFDMMIGAVLAVRMDRINMPRLLQAPILIATFMFGPVGVLLTLLTEGALRLPLLNRT